jgi:hypothetical protein
MTTTVKAFFKAFVDMLYYEEEEEAKDMTSFRV